MGLTIDFDISDAQVRDRMLRVGRRVAAQRIRRAGEACANNAQNLAYANLKVRAPERRRVGGAHYHNSFTVTYEGLSTVEGGSPLSFIIHSSHPMARLIEHGNPGGYRISPTKGSRSKKTGKFQKGRLIWPAGDPSQPGPPWKTLAPGQSVTHPGSQAYKIMENAVRSALRSAFGVSGRKTR